jgi:hypothetical protein
MVLQAYSGDREPWELFIDPDVSVHEPQKPQAYSQARRGCSLVGQSNCTTESHWGAQHETSFPADCREMSFNQPNTLRQHG